MGAKAQFSRLGRSHFAVEDAEDTGTGQLRKINLQNVAYFSKPENDHKKHVYHAFTIKNHALTPRFFETPCKNHTFAPD
jgi:hypothetical protein